MSGLKLPRTRLRVGIAVMFLLVFVPLTGGMVGVLYLQNSQLAYDMAETAMNRTTSDIIINVRSMLSPIARAVDMTVAFAKAQRDGLKSPDSLRPLLETLEQMPNLSSLYYGLARDGTFYEVLHVPGAIEHFGPSGRRPPDGTRYAIRRLDNSSGEMADSYIYLKKWNDVLGVERGPVRYDPRTRPWYGAALKSSTMAISDVYIFSSTGLPGLTLSRQLTTDDGELLGVVGANLSLESLSKFLGSRRIGKGGTVFILDEDGRLIGYPQIEKMIALEGTQITLVKGESVADKVVADAVRLFHTGAGVRFKSPLGEQGDVYLVSFSPFPEDFGKHWMIGIVAAESDFVGPLKRASLVILIIGVCFIVLATTAMIFLSRILTRPIHALIGETARIRHLELDGTADIRSHITEVDELALAVDRMKTGLRSFGAYVSEPLVRGIIESGIGTEIGGERRQLTVMFTDIKGFTATTEPMPPEAVLERLSRYFKLMSSAIHAHHGTVDKFIGDAVMALWNAPVFDDDHVVHACQAMLACRAANDAFIAELAAEGIPPLQTRFGLHTGVGVVGNVGSNDRMQYTALGAMVNLASRVEGLNKLYGTQLLVTGAVEQEVREHFLFRPVGVVIPVGISVPVPMYELIGALQQGAPFPASAEEREAYRRWMDAYEAYHRKDWKDAIDGLEDYLTDHPDDVTASRLLQSSREYLVTPPPDDWDGTTRLYRK